MIIKKQFISFICILIIMQGCIIPMVKVAKDYERTHIFKSDKVKLIKTTVKLLSDRGFTIESSDAGYGTINATKANIDTDTYTGFTGKSIQLGVEITFEKIRLSAVAVRVDENKTRMNLTLTCTGGEEYAYSLLEGIFKRIEEKL